VGPGRTSKSDPDTDPRHLRRGGPRGVPGHGSTRVPGVYAGVGVGVGIDFYFLSLSALARGKEGERNRSCPTTMFSLAVVGVGPARLCAFVRFNFTLFIFRAR
jgi:hypothetical protein